MRLKIRVHTFAIESYRKSKSLPLAKPQLILFKTGICFKGSAEAISSYEMELKTSDPSSSILLKVSEKRSIKKNLNNATSKDEVIYFFFSSSYHSYVSSHHSYASSYRFYVSFYRSVISLRATLQTCL